MMRPRMREATTITLVLTALAPLALLGQEGPRRGRSDVVPGVEGVMRMRERLGLTQDQIGRLDQIRREVVQRRLAQQARIEEVRSQVMAGQVEPGEAREAMRAAREEALQDRDRLRQQVESVLTEPQRDSLSQTMARARAFRMGRQSALRGDERGPRGGQRGFGPGRPGAFGPRGFAPGRGRFAPRGFAPGPLREFGPRGPGPGPLLESPPGTADRGTGPFFAPPDVEVPGGR